MADEVQQPAEEAAEKPVKKTSAKRTSTTRKSPVKPKTDNVEAEPRVSFSLLNETFLDVENIAKAAESKIKNVENAVDREVEELKKLTVPELRQMHQDALRLESEAKRELYALRLRFANISTDVGEEAERELAVARIRVEEAAKWLVKLEKALEGEFKDIVGVVKFGGRH